MPIPIAFPARPVAQIDSVPADASRADVLESVARSIQKLPALAEQNPDGALLIERCIDDFMPAPPRGHRADDEASTCRDTSRRRVAIAKQRITESRALLAAHRRAS